MFCTEKIKIMDNKVQEITDKIYREGVEKGQAEARKIVDAAEAEKASLLKKAQQEAEKIVADARKAADELNRNTQSELKLYASRAVEALKSEIADIVTNTVVDVAVRETVNNEWLQKLMLTLAADWVTKENVVIQTADAVALSLFFATHAKDLLDKGVQIEQVNGKPAAFAIMPADKGYKVQFGEAEFAAYFKEFLRPQLFKIIFD
jgi:V/A-type H+-transporting ATPase subunit E